MLPNATKLANSAMAATAMAFASRMASMGSSARKQAHGLVRQHAAFDLDRNERRLGGKVLARDHDLIDLGGELLDRRRIDQPAEPAPQDRAHAHRAGFARRIERASSERPAAAAGKRAAD